MIFKETPLIWAHNIWMVKLWCTLIFHCLHARWKDILEDFGLLPFHLFILIIILLYKDLHSCITKFDKLSGAHLPNSAKISQIYQPRKCWLDKNASEQSVPQADYWASCWEKPGASATSKIFHKLPRCDKITQIWPLLLYLIM